MSGNAVESCKPERLGEGPKIGKSPKVVRRGCKRSFEPREREASCTGAAWGCTGAKCKRLLAGIFLFPSPLPGALVCKSRVLFLTRCAKGIFAKGILDSPFPVGKRPRTPHSRVRARPLSKVHQLADFHWPVRLQSSGALSHRKSENPMPSKIPSAKIPLAQWMMFQRKNSVSSARNSVSSLWHTNNRLKGTHWVLSPWVHKKLPQSTVKLVLPSNESYEGKTGCNRTLATVLWVPLSLKPYSPKPYSARFRYVSGGRNLLPKFMPISFFRRASRFWGVSGHLALQ